MKQITIRNVPEDLATALRKEKGRRGKSLNQTALDLLRQALGVGSARYTNDLEKFAGTWTNKDLEKFKQDTSIFERVDPELWQ